LEGEGYTCWTFVLPACAVGAHHRRDRVWVVAHTSGNVRGDTKSTFGRSDNKSERTQNTSQVTRSSENVSHANSSQQQRGGLPIGIQPEHANPDISGDTRRQQTASIWLPEPNVGRVANGVPNRSHRLKALGNAVVPPLVAEIGRIVMNFDKGT